jgi:hypothetical protein
MHGCAMYLLVCKCLQVVYGACHAIWFERDRNAPLGASFLLMAVHGIGLLPRLGCDVVLFQIGGKG